MYLLYSLVVITSSNSTPTNYTEDATKKRADSMGFIMACQDKLDYGILFYKQNNFVNPRFNPNTIFY